jgi:hypothetical protein
MSEMAKEKKIVRRKPDHERKKRGITIWVDDAQGELLDRAAGDLPVSTWARAELLRVARLATTEAK